MPLCISFIFLQCDVVAQKPEFQYSYNVRNDSTWIACLKGPQKTRNKVGLRF